MFKNISAALFFLFAIPAWASSSINYDWAFSKYANKYKVDKAALKTLATIESNFNPWAINVNGESFFPQSKSHAINFLDRLNGRPWMLKYTDRTGKKNQTKRLFFKTKSQADQMSFLLKKQRSVSGINIKKLNIRSTDVGIMQINIRWHGKNFRSIFDMISPEKNIEYAASLLRELKEQHGTLTRAVAFYHSPTPKYQNKYLKRFMPVYRKLSI
jgi:soluble lytic murein transglycosylase-like protein